VPLAEAFAIQLYVYMLSDL